MTYSPQACERLLLYLVLTGEPWRYRSQDLDCFTTEELRLMVEVAKRQQREQEGKGWASSGRL